MRKKGKKKKKKQRPIKTNTGGTVSVSSLKERSANRKPDIKKIIPSERKDRIS